MSQDDAKRAAAIAAVNLVEAGMLVGLGTGSTSSLFVRALGERVGSGLQVRGVATSRAIAKLAVDVGIEVVDLPATGVDIAVDGADQVAHDLSLIKGGGGAHVRERIVAAATKRFVVVVDETKAVLTLHGTVPVALLEFGVHRTVATLSEIGHCILRRDRSGAIMTDDDGHLIADVECGEIVDPSGLSAQLDGVPGLVGHGIFVGYADEVITATKSGTVTVNQAVGLR